MPYFRNEPGANSVAAESTIPADLLDAIQVFVYTNLSVIISPSPILVLPNSTKSIILAYVNRYPGFFLPKDLQQVTDAWVLTHINSFIETTSSVGQPGLPPNPP